MSVTHVRFSRIHNSDSEAIYVVESPDFGKCFEWLKIGTIHLNKNLRTYDFVPTSIWTGNNAMPPRVFALPDDERDRVVRDQFSTYGWRAWGVLINGYAAYLLRSETYPERYPESMF